MDGDQYWFVSIEISNDTLIYMFISYLNQTNISINVLISPTDILTNMMSVNQYTD